MAPVSVKVQVFDWDMWNEDDHMGDADFVINLEGIHTSRTLPSACTIQLNSPTDFA